MTAPENASGILLLGSESVFCFHALKTLRDLKLPVAEVLVAAGPGTGAGCRVRDDGSFPLLQPGCVADLAARDGISVIQCASTREDWAFELARELAPEALLVACLPERVGARWFGVPKHGCFNLHPSLLPAYRGPAPLFWQLRDGLTRTGVTVHRIEPDIDAGAILAQEELRIGRDDTLATLNAALAAAGVRMFARCLDRLKSGKASLTPQDERVSSYQPWPTPKDFALDPAWPALRAYRFVRATQSLGVPYPLRLDDARLLIERVVDVDDQATDADGFSENGGVLTIRFAKGILRAVGKRE